MSEGDVYAKQMDEILVLMYDAGAIGLKSGVVNVEAIQKEIGAEHAPLQDMMGLLSDQGLVKMVVRGQYHLTGPGFAEARRIAEARGAE
jgi:Mn-dependent DtxR family transcriptional regulator